MRITTDHPRSSPGTPVILDGKGKVMDYAEGVAAVRRSLGFSREDFGRSLGVSARTIENWEQGRRDIAAPALLLMARMLEG